MVRQGQAARILGLRRRRPRLHPATNTLPIRRLRLAVGGKREIAVAWLRWPELRLERALQRYERLAEDRYRYSSNGFSAELVVDEHGLVVDYEGLWRAIARA